MNSTGGRITFLGTGTSTGVPQIGCTCAVCRSDDPRDRRLRASALVETAGGNILIDCGPDFREQMLRSGEPNFEAVLLTHSHYDHVGGIDDLRPLCAVQPRGEMPVYCRADVDRDLRDRVPYCFREHPYPGVPRFDMRVIREFDPFVAAGLEILPLAVRHMRLDILGFRIGPDLAYITDCKTISDRSVEAIRGIDTLVVNALRHEEHYSHMTIREALELIGRVGPRQAWLIHMSHHAGLHTDLMRSLPSGVSPAYDGLTVEFGQDSNESRSLR